MTRIVALHGFLGRPSDWQSVAEAIKKLTPDCEFEAVDLQADVLAKAKNPKEWSKKFNQLQKSKHQERNVLVGYSMGGRLALHAALDKPGLWDKVVLISANPGIHVMSGATAETRQRADLDWAEKFAKVPWSDLLKEWNNQEVFKGSLEPHRKEKDYDRNQLIHMIKDWSLANHDIKENSLELLKPKLVWYAGERDAKYVNLFQNLRDLGFIEGMHAIPGAGHRVIFDNPTDLAQRLVTDLNL